MTTKTQSPRVSAAVPLSATVTISLMLFSMFFGAGNLIFPPVVSAAAGSNAVPATIGFLIGAVALPVIAVITVALAGKNILDLCARGGTVFNILFSCSVYLSIGAFYAIPRTGAVSFSTAIKPVFGWDSTASSMTFNAVFFGIALLLSLNPNTLSEKLGKFLTPALLALLALLCVVSFFTLTGGESTPAPEYADTPLITGMLEGYMTMDSLAALAFGILLVSAFTQAAGTAPTRSTMISLSATAALIAGALLAVVYIGLAFIGQAMPNGQDFPDGAALLSTAAHMTLGPVGQIVFGLIVLLACMTTAVGLLAATSEFFNQLVPKVSYRTWLTVFSLFSFGVASMGLDTVLSFAGPIINFLYPIALSVVALTIIDSVFKGMKMELGFRFGVWVAAAFSFLMVAAPDMVEWAPLADVQLGWILPVAAAAAVGLVLDRVRA